MLENPNLDSLDSLDEMSDLSEFSGTSSSIELRIVVRRNRLIQFISVKKSNGQNKETVKSQLEQLSETGSRIGKEKDLSLRR